MKTLISGILMFLSLTSYAAPLKVWGTLSSVSTGELSLSIAKSGFLDQSELGKKLNYDECLVKYKNFLSVIQEMIRMDGVTKLINSCDKTGGKLDLNSIKAGEAFAVASGSYIKSSTDINGDNIADKFVLHEGRNAISQLAPHTSNFYVGQHMMQMCTEGIAFDQFIKNWTKDRPDLFNYWRQGNDFVGGLGAMAQNFSAECK